jgi:hypothetical integral membrane protein (TIGR02206 family)
MSKYFEYNYDGPPFELYGTGHIIFLVLFGIALWFLIWGWKNPTEKGRERGRWIVLGIFLVAELSWHIWNVAHDAWTVQRHLPLHSCSITALGTIYVLLTRSHRVYEIVFFLGIAGASQTLITPEAGIYGLPHFRALQTLVAHGMIILALVYMTTIMGMRPTWASIWKTMLFGNLYLVFVTGVNYLLDSNYMYSMHKPETASALDLMGPWPWYLLTAQLVALFLFVLLYLPFALQDRRQKAPAAR